MTTPDGTIRIEKWGKQQEQLLAKQITRSILDRGALYISVMLMEMLGNGSNMKSKVATNDNSAAVVAAANFPSKTRQTREILTSKTSPVAAAKIAKLALPPTQQTVTTTTSLPASVLAMPNPAQSAVLNSTTGNSFYSLTTQDTTLRLSASLSSLATATATISKAVTEAATSSSVTSVENLKLQQIFTNSTPAYLLTTLVAALGTKVECTNDNNNSNINNIAYSSLTNRNCSQAKIAANTDVGCQKTGKNDKMENYHRLTLNHQNFTNAYQHQTLHIHHRKQAEQQQQQHRPQRQCCNKPYQQLQHQKVKQFMLLLTCFVAIITMLSLPHLSTATALHMSTNYVRSTSTSTNTTTNIMLTTTSIIMDNILKNSTTRTHYEMKPLSLASSSPTYKLLTDNESKDDDSHSRSSIADKTFSRPLENLITTNEHYISANHIPTRLKRSLDVTGSSGGSSLSGAASSMFSPSPGSAASLTNIFNQNLDSGLSNSIECPSFDESSACPCYKFEDGKYCLKRISSIKSITLIL